ncbi:T9SS type A sorting domain-containing protein [Pontimicrobium sp. SW4]|uniref:T9SS type A sorting domain-containing protein n=1 Tax=Pontimicrobium sp. SW4 TaxID=3153519 RepID=A0AAU7BRS8_9FLAO
MKKLLPIGVFLILAFIAFKFTSQEDQQDVNIEDKKIASRPKLPKKTPELRAQYAEERALYEYKLQANPTTGEIPIEEKELEFKNSKKAKIRIDGGDNLRAPDASIVNRGPSNLGGRTRTIVFDQSDGTGNTILAGGVSGGVFRTTNGGTSWTKVSSNDEVHSVTSITQDPSNLNTWYYGTGEGRGNSASLGSFFLGDGIWKSTDSGLTWSPMAGTTGTYESYDSFFDIVYKLEVHPTTGDLFAAVGGRIYRYDVGTSTWVIEITNSGGNTSYATDVVITTGGRVYVAFSGNQDANREGVWTSANGEGSWTRITDNTTYPTAVVGGIPIHTKLTGRAVLGLAPSNQNKLYVLYVNGVSSDCTGIAAPEADLVMWDQSTTTWTDYSGKLPDESGCSDGNDPLAVQGGYDLVVSVKPDNENFVVIGGTNAYRMADITAAGSFGRIGGYATAGGYAQYPNHHPDIHALVFNPFNNSNLISGTDGGVRETLDITATGGTFPVTWVNLNNDYQTQQFYHVAIDPQSASDYVVGGLQDNGTNQGGLSAGEASLTTQTNIWGGDGVAVGISRDNANVPVFVGFQAGPIYRIFKNVGGWTDIEPTGATSQFVTYFHLDQSNNKNLYYAGKGVLYRTTDATNVTSGTWTNMGSPTGFGTSGANEWFSRFSASWGAYNPASSYLLMGGDTGTVLRLDDPQNAANVNTAVDITPSGVTSGVVTGLAIHPTNPDIVLLTYSNYGLTNIYITTDATAATPTWTVAERNLSSHSIRSAAITTNTAGEALYLVGTARGLYSSTNPVNGGSGVDWTREAPNLIGYAVVSSLAYRPDDNKLLIGTHGNGMFEATINHVLGIEDNEISKSIKIYPNPVADRLNLNMPSEISDNASYMIHNALGQNVMRGVLENNQIDVDNLNIGIYFLEINSNGKKGVKRFIKK